MSGMGRTHPKTSLSGALNLLFPQEWVLYMDGSLLEMVLRYILAPMYKEHP